MKLTLVRRSVGALAHMPFMVQYIVLLVPH
jgi:hypothetical protein